MERLSSGILVLAALTLAACGGGSAGTKGSGQAQIPVPAAAGKSPEVPPAAPTPSGAPGNSRLTDLGLCSAIAATPSGSPLDPSAYPAAVQGKAPVMVGNGGSCTGADLQTAVDTVAAAGAGVIKFNCSNTVIPFTRQVSLPTNDVTIVIDGGDPTKVALDGQGKTRLLSAVDYAGFNYLSSTGLIEVRNLTFVRGKVDPIGNALTRSDGKTVPIAIPPAPAGMTICSQGYFFDNGGGGAIQLYNARLHVLNSNFLDNQAIPLGPDVGGGAIFVFGAPEVVIQNSTFDHNSGANGGAIGALQGTLTLLGNVFTNNQATGYFANGDDQSSGCPYLAESDQYQTGSGGNGGAVATDGSGQGTYYSCGNVYQNSSSGPKAFGSALFRTPDQGPADNYKMYLLYDWFDGNQAYPATSTDPTGGSGTIFMTDSALTAVNTTVSNNVANGFAGFFIAGGDSPFTMTGVTVTNNKAVGGQAGVFGDGNVGTLINCTIADNDTGPSAVAISIATFALRNSIVGNNTNFSAGYNTGQNCNQEDMSGFGDVAFYADDDVSPCAANLLTVTTPFTTANPLGLAPLDYYGGVVKTRPPYLSPQSPVLGQLGTQSCSGRDARGTPRPSSSCTPGAVQVPSAVSPSYPSAP